MSTYPWSNSSPGKGPGISLIQAPVRRFRWLIEALGLAVALGVNAQQFTEVNWARTGSASQSSTIIDNANPDAGNAGLAIDGNTDGVYNAVTGSTTHSGGVAADTDAGGAYWEVDLGNSKAIGRLHVWFRTDCCQNRNDDFTLVILNANRTEVWRKTYVGRPPSDVAYNLQSAVTGQYVRFEPQNPLTTSDGLFSLAEVQVVAPYQNVSIAVTQQPVDVKVTEGRLATFGPVAASLTGAPQDRLSIQWQKNGVDIPGATGSSYTTPVVQTLADNNAEYTARFISSGTVVSSAKVKLAVEKDSVAPTVESLVMKGGATLEAVVKFNEVLDVVSAQTVANYNFGPGVTVTKAVLSGVLVDGGDQHVYQQVTLGVVGLAQNTPYSVTIGGVKDLGGNPLASVVLAGGWRITPSCQSHDRCAAADLPSTLRSRATASATASSIWVSSLN